MLEGRIKVSHYLFPLAATLLLCSVHFYFLNRYAINIAFSDDYNEILRAMNQILDSRSLSEAMRHFMYGVGYSKPLTLRLISLFHLSLFHEINFRYLVFTGNVFLLLVCLIVMISTVRINPLLLITAACFVFQPQYWEAIYQSTLSNSVFTCLFFSLASFYCVTRQTTLFYTGALVCALMAQLSFGNGFLVYPILLFAAVQHKNSKFFAITFMQLAISTWLYTFGTTVDYKVSENIPFINQLKICSIWYFEFIGSSVGYIFSTSGYAREMPGSGLSTAIGITVTLFYLHLVYKKYYRQNLLLFSFITFFLMTAALAAKFRFNTEVPGASRYQIQSALCIVSVICVIVDLYSARLNRYVIWNITILLPAMFTLLSYNNGMENITHHRTRLIGDMISWQMTGTGLTVWSEKELASQTLILSSNKGIHKIPSKAALFQKYWTP